MRTSIALLVLLFLPSQTSASCVVSSDCPQPDDECCSAVCLDGNCLLACADPLKDGGCGALLCDPEYCPPASGPGCEAYCGEDDRCEEQCPEEDSCTSSEDCANAGDVCCEGRCVSGSCEEDMEVKTDCNPLSCPTSHPGCEAFCGKDGTCSESCPKGAEETCTTSEDCAVIGDECCGGRCVSGPCKEEAEAEAEAKVEMEAEMEAEAEEKANVEVEVEVICDPLSCPISRPDCVASCSQNGTCSESCPSCKSHADCPDRHRCDLEANFCQPLLDCLSSLECPDGAYCANGACRVYGECKSNVDCVNPENEIPFSKPCTGYFVCNKHQTCVKRCRPSGCGVLKPPVLCDANPCEATACDKDFVHCVPDVCGACRAVYLDAAGTRVCEETAASTKGGPARCRRSRHCPQDEYCDHEGRCAPMGTCQRLRDCLRVGNVLPANPCRLRSRRGRLQQWPGSRRQGRRRRGQLTCRRNTCEWSCF